MRKKDPSKIQQQIHLILGDLKLWTRYKKGLCKTCEATCCYMPVEVKYCDLVQLGILTDFDGQLPVEEQIKLALKNPAVKRFTPSTQKFTLSTHPDGRCYYLQLDKTCTIYHSRPETCRNHPQIGPKPHYCAYLTKS